MATPASAYPRLSDDGVSVVAGDRVLVKDRSVEIGSGIGGQFGADGWIYFGGHDGVFRRWRNGVIEVVRSQGFNVFVVAGLRWLGWRPDTGLVWHDGVPWPGWHSPALSETRWAAILDSPDGKVLYAGRWDGQDGQRVAIHARDPVLRGDLLTWVQEDQDTHELSVWGQRSHGASVERLSIPGNARQGYIVPVDVDGQPWALSHDGTRVMLYPWGEFEGYDVVQAPAHRPDGRQLPDRHVRLVWDAEHDVLGERMIDVRSALRVDLRAAPVPQPERLPEGTEIDLLPFIVGDASTWPRHGDHYMHQTWDGRNLHYLKFGPVAEGSTVGDAWERFVLDGDQFYLREDRSQSGAGIYSFHPGRWLKRRMRVGEYVEVPENILQRYEKGSCRVVDQHPLPYRVGLVEAWKHFDCGPSLGIRDVIKIDYDPGSRVDTQEFQWHAHDAGWFQFREQRQDDPSKTHTQSFNQIGGTPLTPTQGCWRRELVPWPPNQPEPPDEEGMTKSELLGVTIDHKFVLGAWTRFIHEVLLGRDIIDGTTREGGLTDTVGTRGAAMYFFPTYYRETMKAIDRLGHVPRNDAEWGGVSIAGFEAAKALYLREQGGGGPTEPPPTGPPPVTGLDRIDGQLGLEPGGGFHVNGRPVLPTLCHYGDALSKWMRDRDHVLRNLDLIAGAGYHGTRYWTCLDGAWWDGRHVGENFQHDYWEQHRAFLLAHKERGLVCQISQGSTTRDALPDPHGFMHRLCDVLQDVGPEVAAVLEGVNEDRDTGNKGPEWLAEFVGIAAARLPQLLRGLSSYTGTEDPVILNRYSRDPAQMFMVHPYRGGRNQDKTRHLMSLQYENGANARLAIEMARAKVRMDARHDPGIDIAHDISESRRQTALETADWLQRHMPHRVEEITRLLAIGSGQASRLSAAEAEAVERLMRRNGWNSEGPGIGNRVSAIDNRDEMTGATMCGLAAMSFMMRMAYVYFCGVGVISDDGGSQTFDQMPGFFEVPKVRALVPADVMRYSGPIFHGGETWRNDRTFAAQGDVRADHVVHHDGRRVIGIYGPGDLNVPQERGLNVDGDHRFGNEFRLVVGRAA